MTYIANINNFIELDSSVMNCSETSERLESVSDGTK
jgi:hypothetical protein